MHRANEVCSAVLRPMCQSDCDVDVLFLLDSSSSVTSGYAAEVQFIRDIADLLHIGPFEHRVALVTYAGLSTKVHSYPWDDFKTNVEFVNTVENLKQISGTTYTGRALGLFNCFVHVVAGYAYDLLQTKRPDTRTLLISITDGYSTDDITENLNKIKSLSNMLLFVGAVNEDNNL